PAPRSPIARTAGAAGMASRSRPWGALPPGVEAYYGGDFAGAARCLERALRSRRELRAARLRCRRRCRGRVRLEAPGPGAGGDLPFFGSVLRRAGCVRRCEEPRLGAASRHRAAEEVRADFQRRVPYSYLQRAYIQVKTCTTEHGEGDSCLHSSRSRRQIISYCILKPFGKS
uniref:Leprecan-like alpha-helical domain-containing protein n=1 Tax=Accipiter nisus TaxID=211598 RepID=A0A8B9MFQ2_9AVES